MTWRSCLILVISLNNISSWNTEDCSYIKWKYMCIYFHMYKFNIYVYLYTLSITRFWPNQIHVSFHFFFLLAMIEYNIRNCTHIAWNNRFVVLILRRVLIVCPFEIFCWDFAAIIHFIHVYVGRPTFVHIILVQPVFVQSISFNPNLT